LNAFFKWVAQERNKVLPKSQIGKAMDYCTKHHDSLMNYLNNGELAIDNNAVENCIRPIALGRKNYLFAKNHESAQRAAIMYTFMAICKQHEVNPFVWLKHVLRHADETPPSKLENLLPQNFKKQPSEEKS
jgi:transposase